MIYLAMNLGVAAAFVVAHAVRKALERYGHSIRFRDQLFASRAVLLVALLVATAAAWFVHHQHVTWAYSLLPRGEETDAMVGAIPRTTRTPLPLTGVLTDAATSTINWSALLFAGASWQVVRALLQHRRLAACLKDSVILHHHGRTIVAACDAITVPFSVRTWRARWVVLPVQTLASRSERQLALRHELQHHRHGDGSWAWGSQALAIVYWPNPVVHLWQRWHAHTQELACDEALRDRSSFSVAAYARCLLNVAEQALRQRRALSLTVAMAAPGRHSKNHLQRRIEMLFRSPSRPLSRIILTTMLAGAAAASLGVSALAASLSAAHRGNYTVDPQVQKIADEALASAMRSGPLTGGMVVVADPNDGRILAMAHAGSRRDPLHERLEPASLAKTVIAAFALAEGTTAVGTQHDCEHGAYTSGGHTYRDYQPFTTLSTRDTIALSSNICAIKIANTLGAQRTRAAFTTFGFGEVEFAGHLPEASEGADTSVIATYALGAAPFLATPLELVRAYGAIANGGHLLVPRDATDHSAPVEVRQVLSEKVASDMRDILMSVVTDGTAASHLRAVVPAIAGKTGSMTYAPAAGGQGVRSAASFLGFAPATAPRFVALVYLEGASEEPLTGGGAAAPVFAQISQRVLALSH